MENQQASLQTLSGFIASHTRSYGRASEICESLGEQADAAAFRAGVAKTFLSSLSGIASHPNFEYYANVTFTKAAWRRQGDLLTHSPQQKTLN